MSGPGRYLRIWLAFARFGLASELAFRVNFLIKLVVEALWLAILILFFELIYARTDTVAGWSREEYFFFLGCHYALSGVIEALFLENCTHFAELIRSGDLDFYLLRPIDEQFLVTTRQVDWSTVPNVLQGAGLMVYGLVMKGWQFDAGILGLFLLLFVCGVAMAYSFLLILASLAVWLVRNQSIMELWWLFSTLMRYPRGIFEQISLVGKFFTFVVPVLLIVSIPVETILRALDLGFVLGMLAATVLLLVVSRKFFRHALKAYRSASS